MTEIFSETYLKKLVGRTDIEDALKRLDRLTQEEARMVTAQILKATHNVHDGFKGVADKVVGVDDRVAREVIQQAADGVDRVERSWFPKRIHAGHAGSIILTY